MVKKMTVHEAFEMMEEGITKLKDENDWKRYLKAQAALHKYSFNNIVLALSQKSDISQLGSFKAWKNIERTVRKGEKSIKIYAPIFKAKGKEKKEEIKTKDEKKKDEILSGFILVPVFDISQTEGKEISKITLNELSGSHDNAESIIEYLENIIDIPIVYTDTEEDYGYVKKYNQIIINPEKAKDEIARFLVKSFADYEISKKNISEDLNKEIITESTEFIVCQHFGFDTSEYSFSSVLSWSKGDTEVIKKAGNEIHRLSYDIIKKIEKEN